MTTAPEHAAWDELKTLLRWALAIFGEPAELCDDRVLRRSDALLLRRWIAALEAIARALLMLIAARLPKPGAARPRRSSARSGAHLIPLTEDAGSTEGPVDSRRWAGVVFRALPLRSQRSGGRPGEERRFLSARSLAFRFEALIRVAETPEPFAWRLARRLHAEPALAELVLRRPPEIGGRAPPHEDLIDLVLPPARSAAAVFADSG